MLASKSLFSVKLTCRCLNRTSLSGRMPFFLVFFLSRFQENSLLDRVVVILLPRPSFGLPCRPAHFAQFRLRQASRCPSGDTLFSCLKQAKPSEEKQENVFRCFLPKSFFFLERALWDYHMSLTTSAILLYVRTPRISE